MIIATRIYTINAENREQAVAAMNKEVQIARQMSGIITHGFYADVDDPTIIRFYGEFETVEALEAQIKSQHKVHFNEAIAELGVKLSPGTVSMYTAVPEYPFN